MLNTRKNTNKFKVCFKILLFSAFLILLSLVFPQNPAEAQCSGGIGSDFVCGTNTSVSFQGSDQFGFDQNLALQPALNNRNPANGPCIICSDGTISATSGSYTDSFLGEVRAAGMGNKGDLARSPEAQGIILPTDPGGDGTIPIMSLPLPPFFSVEFTYTDADVFTVDPVGNGIGPFVTSPLPPAESFNFSFSGSVFAAGVDPSGAGNGNNGIPDSNQQPPVSIDPFDPSDINFNFVDPGFGAGPFGSGSTDPFTTP